MKKRAAALLSSVILVFGLLSFRIYALQTQVESVQNLQASKVINAGRLRGTVFDCKMKPITNAKLKYYAAVKPTNSAYSQIAGMVDDKTFSYVCERLMKSKPMIVPIDGLRSSTSDVLTFSVPERYEKNQLACHIVGYIDSDGRGRSGIEKSFDGLLSSTGKNAVVRFRSDAKGRIMNGCEIEVSGNERPRGGIILTIDRDIQRVVENALDKSGVECGCAVVMEIGTGAIRACASRPTFDPENIAVSLNDEKSPLINRAFHAFSTGSVFKSVIAAAALENGITGYEFDCDGEIEYNAVKFNCHKKDGHGTLNLEEAIMFSCNTFFASLGQRVGAESIVETASKFGFGKSVKFANGIESASGNLPRADELDSKAAIANISFGQGSLTATPVQICAMTCAIADNGFYSEPYLVSGEADENGIITKYERYSEHRQIISEKTALFLRNALRKVVEQGSGKKARSAVVSSAGKTATAQTGRFNADGEIFNAWFSGFFPAEKPKYAVTVLVENGGEGASSCAPIFKSIAESITMLSY